jgi:hypothetical protein
MNYDGLKAEAQKHGSFESFRHSYLNDIFHGRYYHFTDNPNFSIDNNKGPRDMSSLSNLNQIDAGKLMVTSDPKNWNSYYNDPKPTRPYAAVIDLSEAPKGTYFQINRGFGNEIYVNQSQKFAKVVKVISAKQAVKEHEKYKSGLPNSDAELQDFYTKANQ